MIASARLNDTPTGMTSPRVWNLAQGARDGGEEPSSGAVQRTYVRACWTPRARKAHATSGEHSFRLHSSQEGSSLPNSPWRGKEQPTTHSEPHGVQAGKTIGSGGELAHQLATWITPCDHGQGGSSPSRTSTPRPVCPRPRNHCVSEEATSAPRNPSVSTPACSPIVQNGSPPTRGRVLAK